MRAEKRERVQEREREEVEGEKKTLFVVVEAAFSRELAKKNNSRLSPIMEAASPQPLNLHDELLRDFHDTVRIGIEGERWLWMSARGKRKAQKSITS